MCIMCARIVFFWWLLCEHLNKNIIFFFFHSLGYTNCSSLFIFLLYFPFQSFSFAWIALCMHQTNDRDDCCWSFTSYVWHVSSATSFTCIELNKQKFFSHFSHADAHLPDSMQQFFFISISFMSYSVRPNRNQNDKFFFINLFRNLFCRIEETEVKRVFHSFNSISIRYFPVANRMRCACVGNCCQHDEHWADNLSWLGMLFETDRTLTNNDNFKLMNMNRNIRITVTHAGSLMINNCFK